jgi:hypothetical protein
MFFEREPGILPGGRVHPGITAQIASTRGNGVPLGPALNEEMSTALGHDFSDVRVHTDSLAGKLAKAVEARAFTTGADVYFGGGEFTPSSTDGRRLLAHELRHVVQQRGLPTSGDLTVTDPDGALEKDAEQASTAV